MIQELKDKEIIFLRLQECERQLDEYKKKEDANAHPGFFSRFFGSSSSSGAAMNQGGIAGSPAKAKDEKMIAESRVPGVAAEVKKESEPKEEILPDDILKEIQKEFSSF